MRVKDVSLSTPLENILFDDVLLSIAEAQESGEALRFWESQEVFVVLGRIGKPDEDVKIDPVLTDNIKMLRRSSGGGTVLQGRGCLNYTLVLSKERREIADLKRSYQYILGKIIHALASLNVQCNYFPISDIALTENKKKISGNAQKRGRRFIMHHGTLLIDFNLMLMEKYLTLPRDIPEYRKCRSHTDFIANLNVLRDDLKESIQGVFHASEIVTTLDEREQNMLGHLIKTRGEEVIVKTVRE